MNPYIGLSELYGKLKRNYSYTRHPASLFRFLRKKGIYVTPEATKPKYEPKPYDTPKTPGEKLQLDVKYVPKGCYKALMVLNSINILLLMKLHVNVSYMHILNIHHIQLVTLY